jgi:hypothetical protein
VLLDGELADFGDLGIVDISSTACASRGPRRHREEAANSESAEQRSPEPKLIDTPRGIGDVPNLELF